ncbi:MAG: GAF domain-containing protein, partial [Candidatus Pacebacteria bacterium]|nr:GAF domain-containing protein [Candidatus Paceibacterota bacterium]
MTVTRAILNFQDHTQLPPLFDSLDEGVIIWGKDKDLVYANRSARRITNLPLAPGTQLKPAGAAMSVRIVENASSSIRRAPVYRAFDGENVPREEMQYIDPDGKHKWLSVSAKRILDASGALEYVISSMRDISIRKSRENKLEFMVESAKILSLNLDFDQRLVEKAKLAVPNLADWCSMSVLEDGVVRHVAVINIDPENAKTLHEFDKKYSQDAMLNTIRNQTPIFIPLMTEEILQTMSDSGERMEDIRNLGIRSFMIIPIISRGEGVGAMTLAYTDSGRTYDETDLEFFQEFCFHLAVVFDNARLFHEIETRDKSKEIFLAALSHELRNPLAPIKSSLELLKLRNTPTDIKEELDIVEHQFDHMARLLNDLLDVTRFTQDRISLSAKPIDLRRLIERSVRATDGVIRSADITLHLAYPSVPLSVVADETRLEQAVSNLLSNAVKFTPAGGSIWVDIERDGVDVLIRVRDNGAGIDAADLPRIFDMYYQGANKSTINSGLGIGLLLVQRIINMHGGSVEAQSEGKGAGSEFIIRLPLVDITVNESRSDAHDSLARNLRILVVD